MPLRCLVFLLALMLLPANLAPAMPLDRVLRALDENADLVRKDLRVPGLALAVVQGDQVVFKKCWGLRKVGDPAPVTPDTVFQIASISKSFTASLAAMEMAAGRLASKGKVVTYRPDFKMYDPQVTAEFTVEDLMAHRSGLVPCAGDFQLLFGKERGELVHALQYIPPAHPFRSTYAYQNVPLIEVAAIVESLSGRRWEDDLAARLFGPLGMKATTDLQGYLGSPDRAALHQEQKDGSIAALPDNWPWMGVAYIVGPAGGINASLNDMIPYLVMQMNHGRYNGKQVVDAAALDDLHQPRTPLPGGILGRTAAYCQAFIREDCDGYTLIWHNGGSPGHKSILIFDPDARLGMVALTNLMDTNLPEYLTTFLFRLYHNTPQAAERTTREMRTSVQAPLKARPAPAIPAKAAPSRPLADYVGDYESPVHGVLRIQVENGGLAAVLGRDPVHFPLVPMDKPDSFWLELPHVDGDASGPVNFQAGPDGRVNTAVLPVFVENGAGVFTRKQGASRP